MDFDKFISDARTFITDDNISLKINNGKWQLSDRISIWEIAAKNIFDEHLDLFKSVCIEVLSEIDPRFELGMDKRYYSNIQGKVLKHSNNIRKGFSKTLALLGVKGNELSNCSQHKPEFIAKECVSTILNSTDWRLWASLNEFMPIIAEASPDDFLNAVESALQAEQNPFIELFNQESPGPFGGNYLTGLLWALEVLSWKEDNLARSSMALAELATFDPGGNWANRPVNSLIAIFLPWYPQTNASVEKRIKVMGILKENYPAVFWEVSLQMMPEQHQTSSGTMKPKWRDIVSEDWKPEVSGEDYRVQVQAYAAFLVDLAKENPISILEFVKNIDNIPQPSLDDALNYLASKKITKLSEIERKPIWEELCNLSRKHNKFIDAKWSFDQKTIDKIESIAEQIKPVNPLYLYDHLFSISASQYFDGSDWREKEKRLEQERQDALKLFLQQGGLENIFFLIESVDDVRFIGFSLAAIADAEMDNSLLPELLDTEEQKKKTFIQNYSYKRYLLVGKDWLKDIEIEKWEVNLCAELLKSIPFVSYVWFSAEEILGKNEYLYWNSVNTNPYLKEGENLFHAVDKLLEYNRPFSAIDCLNGQLFTDKTFDRDRTIKALIYSGETSEEFNSDRSYSITELIKALQKDSEGIEDALFQIEFKYLPLLDGHRNVRPVTLEKKLGDDPKFFCEAVGYLYKAKKSDEESSDNEMNEVFRSNVWNLLHKWHIVPGTDKNSEFDKEKFILWIDEVKSIMKDSDLFDVTMIKVGNVLCYTKEDPDGLWINQAVADVLNDKGSDYIRRGFSTEVYNSRGVHTVDSSGKQEYDLSKFWMARADDIENAGFVTFAVTCREIAHSYEREAETVKRRFGNEFREEDE